MDDLRIRIGAFLAALVIALLFTLPQAPAQAQDLETVFRRFRKHIEAGQYKEAEVHERRLVALAEKGLGKDHPGIAPLLSQLALLHQHLAHYDTAAELYARALAIKEKELGGEHPEVAHILNMLGGVLERQVRHEEAAQLHARALAIRERALGPEHPEVAHSLNNLANVHQGRARYREAAELYARAITIYEKAFGPAHPDVGASLNNLALVHYLEGRYDAATQLYTKALAIREKALGAAHTDVALNLNNLALVHHQLGRYEAAARLHARALAIREKALGAAHPDVAVSINNLALVHQSRGRYAEAARLHARALAIFEKALGPAHPDIANVLNALATLDERQGRYEQSARLHGRTLAIREKALGPEHPDVALSLSNLALALEKQARFDEAAMLHERALAIREKALGAAHPDVAHSVNALAVVRLAQARFDEASRLFARGLVLREKALGSEHPDVAQSLNNLAAVHQVQGRYEEAAQLFARGRIVRERALGSEHPDVAHSLNNLAVVHRAQGHYEEAARLFARALALRESALGTEHPDVAQSLNELANVHYLQGRFDEAARLSQRALAIREKVFGKDHLQVAYSLSDLASVQYARGQAQETGPIYLRVLAILEKALGLEHPEVATGLNNLANVYSAQGRHEEAARLHTRALAIREKALGAEHPDVAHTLGNLALVHQAQGRHEEAARLHTRAAAIREKALGSEHPDLAASLYHLGLVARAQGRTDDWHAALSRAAAIQAGRIGTASGPAGRESASNVLVFRGLAEAAWRLAGEQPERAAALANDAFGAAQWATLTSAGDALSQMAIRLATDGGGVAPLVRETQDLAAARSAADTRLIEALGAAADKRNENVVAALRAEIARIDDRLRSLQERLEREFPEFVELAKPRPLSIADAQALLGPDTALVAFLLGEPDSFVWAITRQGWRWERIQASEGGVGDKVALLRRSIDDHIALGFQGGDAPADCDSGPGARPGGAAAGKVDCTDLGLFDLALAHDVYATLFGPIADLVKDKPQLIVIPTGPLTSLPFSALVSEPPETGRTGREAYRRAAWLFRRHAVTVLPSVPSLRALRQYAKGSRASKPFVGFGDPVFGKAQPAPTRRPAAKQRTATRELATYFRGALADRGELGRLTPLPNTADELRAMARSLGAPENDIVLGQAATETAVKHMSAGGQLSQYRVVAFATHGLVAGEIKGLAEPGLVLSLPEVPSTADDGLLTASEVATLNLDADWVILSACNTAAGEKPGAEALSGLARTFFYAGTRALLVSHWPVETQAAEFLTTQTFAELHTAAPGQPVGRAEALRRAMLALVDKEPHPAVWAPFMVVGEGEAGR